MDTAKLVYIVLLYLYSIEVRVCTYYVYEYRENHSSLTSTSSFLSIWSYEVTSCSSVILLVFQYVVIGLDTIFILVATLATPRWLRAWSYYDEWWSEMKWLVVFTRKKQWFVISLTHYVNLKMARLIWNSNLSNNLLWRQWLAPYCTSTPLSDWSPHPNTLRARPLWSFAWRGI